MTVSLIRFTRERPEINRAWDAVGEAIGACLRAGLTAEEMHAIIAEQWSTIRSEVFPNPRGRHA